MGLESGLTQGTRWTGAGRRLPPSPAEARVQQGSGASRSGFVAPAFSFHVRRLDVGGKNASTPTEFYLAFLTPTLSHSPALFLVLSPATQTRFSWTFRFQTN